MTRTRMSVVAAMVGVVALGAAWTASTRGGAEAARAAVADVATGPGLRDLAGRKVSLEALRGRAVAVNFWATWCPPCQQEIPELAAFYRAHRGSCFELVGVAEESGDAHQVGQAAKELGIPYPVVLDPGAGLARRFGISSLPHTVIFDGSGQVRRVFMGAIDRRQLEEALAPLLSPPGKRCDA